MRGAVTPEIELSVQTAIHIAITIGGTVRSVIRDKRSVQFNTIECGFELKQWSY
jgi:hypothetical protein